MMRSNFRMILPSFTDECSAIATEKYYAHPEAADQPFAPTGQGRLQQRLTARRKCVFHFQGVSVFFPSLVLSNFTSFNIACYAGYLTKS